MAASSELSERKKQILKAIVDAHSQMGEPVGSKYLTQSQQFTCSSATIRNEMAELEGLGYLEQPHTSAGRVPSEAGYRFYVDWLIDKYRFNASEIERLITVEILKKGAPFSGAVLEDADGNAIGEGDNLGAGTYRMMCYLGTDDGLAQSYIYLIIK